MSKAALRSLDLGRARPSAPKFDKRIIIPVLAIAFTIIIAPVLDYTPPSVSHYATLKDLMESKPENKYFWPALFAISVVLAVRNHSRLALPPHIVCLLAYLALAGLSVLWAFKPDISLTRFVLEVMIITSIVLPAMLAARTTDMMRCVFLCYAFSMILNVYFVNNQLPDMLEGVSIGYPGYFSFKGILGETASIALLLSFHEILFGRWRVLAVIVAAIAIYHIVASMSKGSAGLVVVAPSLAALALFIARKMRVSAATVLLSMLLFYSVLSTAVGFTMNKLSYRLYGNYTFSGRAYIWECAKSEIARKPLLGWGYQSFWLVGPDAPSLTDCPGWVGRMPSAHSGYLDTKIETGNVGYVILIVFLIATVRAIGQVADYDRARAWLLLSLALYVILTSFLETTWMRGAEPLWMLFLMVTAEAGRHCHHFRPSRGALEIRASRPPRPRSARPAAMASLASTGDSHTGPRNILHG